jgi:hypothetical protein
LRILFALAQGIPIIEENWIYQCISAGLWVDATPFRPPRYAKLDLTIKHLFKNHLFCVLHSSRPETKQITSLIRTAGGKITENPNIKEKISFFVVGDLSDLRKWGLYKKERKTSQGNLDLLRVEELVAKGTKMISSKVSLLLFFLMAGINLLSLFSSVSLQYFRRTTISLSAGFKTREF